MVTKSGSFFSYEGERLGQGRTNSKAYLDQHPEMAREIEARIYTALEIVRHGQPAIVGAEEPPVENGAVPQVTGAAA